jgi:hypothetical protein
VSSGKPAVPEAEAEFLRTHEQLVDIARRLSDLNLPRFLSQGARVLAFGPIVDPALHRRSGASLGAVQCLAEAAMDFQRRLRRSGVLVALSIDAPSERASRPRL